MAIQPHTPLFMRDATLTVAADDFATPVQSMTLTPSVSTVTFKGLKPTAVWTAATTPTWTLDITAGQDETDDGLFMYLWTAQGEEVEFTFTPRTGGRAWTVTAIVVPGAVGGAVDTFATFTVSLPVVGQPSPDDLA